MYGYAGLGDITPTFELGSARTFQGALDGAPVFLRVRSCRTPSTFAQLDYDTERWTHALGAGHQVRASEAGLVACVAPRCQGASLSELAQSSLDAHGFVTAALAAARELARVHHLGLIHQNLKPSNVFVNGSGAQLTDPGSAGLASEHLMNSRDAYVLERCLPYLAPEQTGRLGRAVDHRADLYAFGVTLYELLSGVRPFVSSDPLELIHAHMARRPPEIASPLAERVPLLSRIIQRLLEKDPDDRYQSARGLLHDLEACGRTFGASARTFELGERDTSEVLVFSEALYGRDIEREWTVAGLEQAKQGTPNLFVLSGPPGAGKSTLARSIARMAYVRHCRFGHGKCDQLRLDRPYFAIREALAEVAAELLLEPERSLADWRARFSQVAGGLGGTLLELCPLLGRIVGPQPEPPALEPQEAQARTHLAVERWLEITATLQRPIVWFLDDLQWADAGTLKLLQHVLTSGKAFPLLVVVAYRDNEVHEQHPAVLSLEAIARYGTVVRKRSLAPLSAADISDMLRDTLGEDSPLLAELVQVVSEKTLGNPYFVRVFLASLAQRGILTFDAGWRWSIARARALPATENVVSLLCDRMQYLPEETREVLEHAAVLGGSASLDDIVLSSGLALVELLRRLAPAVAADLVRLEAAQLHFQHDRVQEAARAMIGARQLPARHLEVGQLWQKSLAPSVLDDRIFELVGHLNAARELLAPSERIELSRMNLKAVGKAKRSGAFAQGLELARQGLSSLDLSVRHAEYALYFELSLERAELTFCSGDFAGAEVLARELRRIARRPIDEAAALGVLLKQYVVQARFEEAIETAREALALVGVELPTERRRVQDKLSEERPRTDQLLHGRSPPELFALPEMQDPAARLALELLVRVTAAIFFYRPDMLHLDIVLMVNLSLEYGNTPASAFAYTELGYLWTLEGRDRRPAYAFAELGLHLAEHFGDPIQYCRAAHIAAWIQHHVRHHREAEEIYRRGFAAGAECGESEWAAYHCYLRAARILLLGEELAAGAREMERLREYVKRVSSHSIVELLESIQRHVSDLTRDPSDTQHETKTAQLIASWEAIGNPQAVFIYRSFRAFTLLIERRYPEALQHAEAALALSVHAPAHPFVQLAHFARGLASLAQLEVGQPIPEAALEEIEHARRASRDCPPNYAAQLELLEAESSRVRGEGWAAGERYDKARRLAALHGFVQEEGLADQLAARLWLELDSADFALTCLRRARSCWARWGATYAEQLVAREIEERTPGGESPSDILDFQSILKSIQAISAELDHSRLLLRLIRVMMENAGAQRAALIIRGERGLELAAFATADGREELTPVPLDASEDVCAEIIRHTDRRGEPLVLADAAQDRRFSSSEYLRRHQVRSVLCLPVKHAEVRHGIVYLDNALVAGAFTPRHRSVLEALATQAGIALENAELFARSLRAERTLRASEEDLRTTLDSIGDAVMATDMRGRITRMNPVARELTGWTLGEALGQHISKVFRIRTAATGEPAVDPVARVLESGQIIGLENHTVLVAKDGRERQIADSGAPIRDPQGVIVGVVLVFRDVTERHHLEERLRQSQKMDALGRLAGGVAHDFNNMLTGIMAAAELLGLRLDALDVDDPDDNLHIILQSAQRAAELTRQLLVFSRQRKPAKKQLDLNRIIEEARALLARSIDPRIFIECELSAQDALVLGDPALLQSAVLNLGINARDAMPEGGKLRIVTRNVVLGEEDCAQSSFSIEPGPYVELVVQDDGAGMDAQTEARIFEPFFTTKGVGKGTGLGLAAVHGTLVEHRGAIQVESSPGRGTTFTLWLPTASPAPRAVEIEGPSRPVAQRLRVLLVDDEPAVQDTVRRMLQSQNASVLTASDGREGVDIFAARHREIDIVLLDSLMPALSGADVFYRLQAIDRSVPVLMVSGYAADAPLDDLQRKGLAGFLMKPFTRIELMAAVEKALSHGGRQREGRS